MAGGNRQVSVLLAAAPDQFMGRLQARLRAEGCAVEVARTAAEALEAIAKRFDVILLDLRLPDTDGLTVLRQLRAQDSATPIFLLKGEGEPSHVVQRGFDYGASGYLSKHRLPDNPAFTAIIDSLIMATSLLEVHDAGNVGIKGGRPDTCPYSSRHEFGRCPVYLPLSVTVSDGAQEALVSCSHLRIGTGDTWRLYPRCAIGDQAARDRYLEDRAPVLDQD